MTRVENEAQGGTDEHWQPGPILDFWELRKVFAFDPRAPGFRLHPTKALTGNALKVWGADGDRLLGLSLSLPLTRCMSCSVSFTLGLFPHL